MAVTRVIRDGESVAGIAFEAGLLPETIWHHPENAALKARRDSGHALLDGVDQLHVPDRRPKKVEIPIDRRTTFRRPNVPDVLRIRLLDEQGRPRAGLPYLLAVAGQADATGRTDADGGLVQAVPPGARKGVLTLRNEWEELETCELFLSHLDPAGELGGIQQRLCNLGFDCAAEYGRFGPLTEAALLAFQAREGLPSTGAADAATRARIDALHRF